MTDACCPSSADRAELVEKWKAEREARLARGEEEEGEEEEEVNIYAVADSRECRARRMSTVRMSRTTEGPGQVTSST